LYGSSHQEGSREFASTYRRCDQRASRRDWTPARPDLGQTEELAFSGKPIGGRRVEIGIADGSIAPDLGQTEELEGSRARAYFA